MTAALPPGGSAPRAAARPFRPDRRGGPRGGAAVLALLFLLGAALALPGGSGAPGAEAPAHAASVAAPLLPRLSCSGTLQAQASASSGSGGAPFDVTYTGAACGGTPPYSWLWTLGNGQTATTQDVTDQVYDASGLYDVSLEVTDAVGDHAWSNLTETVYPTLTTAASVASGTSPLSVTFWGNVSGTTSASVITWKFGDGSEGSAASGAPVSHVYASVGNYTATATATVSGSSWKGSGSEAIEVEGTHAAPAPLALQLLPTPVLGSAPLPVDVSAQATGGTGPYALTVCFGDGSACSATLHGWSGASTSVNHTYASPGVFTLSASVVDATGTSVSSSSTVSVEGVPALQVQGKVLETAGTAPFSATFVASVSGGSPPYAIEWNFGDGSSGSGVPGVPTTHVYTSAGTFQPVLTVTDVDGHAQSVDLGQVTVQGASPGPAPAAPPGFPSFGLPEGPWVSAAAIAGLIGVLVVVVLLEERRRHRDLEDQARDLVEAMESAKGLP